MALRGKAEKNNRASDVGRTDREMMGGGNKLRRERKKAVIGLVAYCVL